MNTTPMKLVTIIAEHILRDRILEAVRAAGSHGYTISEVRGEGTRGIHASKWQGGNYKIETLVNGDVAERILGRMAADYFQDFAVIVYVADVQVIRSDKFA